jgi:hypothetical protein
MEEQNRYPKIVLNTLRYSLGEFFTINVLWALFLIPVITIPPSFAGLYHSADELAQDKKVTWRTFLEGVNKYYKVSYFWFFANLIVVGSLLFGININQFTEVEWLQFMTGFYRVVLVVWLFIQLYAFPFLIVQKKPRLMLAFRNSTVLWRKYAFFSLGVMLVVFVVSAISTVAIPLWAIFSASLIAFLSTSATRYLVAQE